MEFPPASLNPQRANGPPSDCGRSVQAGQAHAWALGRSCMAHGGVDGDQLKDGWPMAVIHGWPHLVIDK